MPTTNIFLFRDFALPDFSVPGVRFSAAVFLLFGFLSSDLRCFPSPSTASPGPKAVSERKKVLTGVLIFYDAYSSLFNSDKQR